MVERMAAGAYVAPPVVLAMAKHPAFEGRDFGARTSVLSARRPAGDRGQALPPTELRLVSVETGEDVGPAEEGESWIRGPQRMLGCSGRHEETVLPTSTTPR